MKNLLTAGRRAIVSTEVRRLKRSQSRQLSRRSRSQFTGAVAAYDATAGHAIARLPDGGQVYARSITNSASRQVAVAIPRRSTIAIADAKPTFR